jgi:hypothetical protein
MIRVTKADEPEPCRPRYPWGRGLALKLGPGDIGTAQTIGAMIGLIQACDATGHVAALAQIIREEAAALVTSPNSATRTRDAEIRALWEFLRRSVWFEADPRGTELCRSPDRLIDDIARTGRTNADCDDLATLGAALARAMGYRVALVTCARQPAPAEFEHVLFAIIDIDDRLIPIDSQEASGPGLWPPQHIERCMVYGVPPLAS